MILLSLLRSGFYSLASLFLVFDDVLELKLAHSLNFIQINYKARVLRVFKFDAFSTEDCSVIRAVEMLYSL